MTDEPSRSRAEALGRLTGVMFLYSGHFKTLKQIEASISPRSLDAFRAWAAQAHPGAWITVASGKKEFPVTIACVYEKGYSAWRHESEDDP